MRKTILGAALAAACGLALADPVPVGAVLTGSASGAATGLLGLDTGFADVAGSNVTAVSATELEFLSNDFAVGIDFLTDGTITFYDNTGTGLLAGSYSFSFDIEGLDGHLLSFALGDTAGLAGGSIVTQLLGDRAVGITLTDVAFSSAFGSFSAQLTVPEPTTPALVLAGLAMLWGARRAPRRTGD